MSDPAVDLAQGDIVANAGRYYRNARYIIVAMALLAGLWFAYDGFVRWPAELREFEGLTPAQQAGRQMPHQRFSIALQQVIAGTLIPLAPILLAFFLYRSRGSYRLSGTTLSVPGHPPVPFEAIVGIDKSKWERKGIACVDYQLEEGGTTRRLTLDDFLYDQTPTDEIVKRIDAYLGVNPAEGEEA